jgi:predicted RNA-binding Zn-ribbon protein involved in translation (DUF1610 family)
MAQIPGLGHRRSCRLILLSARSSAEAWCHPSDGNPVSHSPPHSLGRHRHQPLPRHRQARPGPALHRRRTQGCCRNGDQRARRGSCLGVPDDSRSRATLHRMLRAQRIDMEHFSHRRIPIPEGRLRDLVQHSTSYADVMRGLGLDVNDTNHRRVRRAASRLGLDTSHFIRKAWGRPERPAPAPTAHRVLVVLPHHAGRTNRTQLHRALSEIGAPYTCEACGNKGEWLGQSITLQIDHVNGDWRDNRRENLRYLCPNCHALTETWCRRKGSIPLAG